MMPTTKLRFIDRWVTEVKGPDMAGWRVRVLQQEWAAQDVVTGLWVREWRDVPLEQEGK